MIRATMARDARTEWGFGPRWRIRMSGITPERGHPLASPHASNCTGLFSGTFDLL
jgi:hypothetical protein